MEKNIGNQKEINDMFNQLSEEDLLNMALEESLKLSDESNNYIPSKLKESKPIDAKIIDDSDMFELVDKEENKENH